MPGESPSLKYTATDVIKTLESMDKYCRAVLPSVSICFFCMPPGIKFIPLRTPGGESIPESGLFVRIKKVEERHDHGGRTPSLRHQDEVPEEPGEFSGLSVLDDVDVTQSINPGLRRSRQEEHDQHSPLSSLKRFGSSPSLESRLEPVTTEGKHEAVSSLNRPGKGKKVEVHAEVYGDSSQTTSTAEVNARKQGEQKKRAFSVTLEPSQPTLETHSVVIKSKDQGGSGDVPVVEISSEKEYSLEIIVKTVDEDDETTNVKTLRVL